MLQSVVDDIKGQFQYGNMISRLMLVNLFVFLSLIIVKAFSPPSTEIFSEVLSYMALPSVLGKMVLRPWTLLTHMFVHVGVWHLAWNMIMLYWFGRIVGDLIGDKKILPLYILGGLFGAVFYLVFANLTGSGGIAFGASAAVMCFVATAGFVAPEYIIHLILIGPVRLKYVALALIVLDFVAIANAQNTGGSIAHIGGAIFGVLYVNQLRAGNDLTTIFQPLIRFFSGEGRESKPKMTVVHKHSTRKKENMVSDQEIIDSILDKISASGYDSLTEEEKEILYQASKK